MIKITTCRLFDDIIEACRQKAATLEGFESGDGCIRISYLPQNTMAVDILEANTCFADRYELCARISPEGNYVINRGRQRGAPVDTYAFSALKVAACLKAIEMGIGERSGYDLNDLACDEEHGFASYRGAICYTLCYEHRAFALLVVCASGASAIEDEAVAEAATEAIKKWCAQDDRLSVDVPEQITPR